MSYLQPPPMPAPVVVVKDVGGFVADYQTQTAIYRATGQEVRLHECRSACTLALSLPNVCVYPDSRLKFHLAYDPRNRAVNAQVSQQLFGSYPAPVQARLGTLTREYKVLRGDELIALGVRDCNAPKSNEPQIMVASAAAGKPPRAAEPGAETPLFAGMFDKMLSVFGAGEAALASRTATLPRPAPGPKVLPEEILLPPPRPAEFAETSSPDFSHAPGQAGVQTGAGPAQEPQAGSLRAEAAEATKTKLSPLRTAQVTPQGSNSAAARERSKPQLPAIITGAQPILLPRFCAYAELDR